MILDIAEIETIPTLHFCMPRARDDVGAVAVAGEAGAGSGARKGKDTGKGGSTAARTRRRSLSLQSISELSDSVASTSVTATIFCDCGGYGSEEADAARVPSAVKVSVTPSSTAESVCAAVASVLGLFNDMDFSLFQYRNGFHRRVRDDEGVAKVVATWSEEEVAAGEAVGRRDDFRQEVGPLKHSSHLPHPSLQYLVFALSMFVPGGPFHIEVKEGEAESRGALACLYAETLRCYFDGVSFPSDRGGATCVREEEPGVRGG